MKWYRVAWTYKEGGKTLACVLVTRACSVKLAKRRATQMWAEKYTATGKIPRMCGITVREET